MSTPILDNVEGVYFNQFHGGTEKGICHQITMGNSGVYIQLTARQMELIVAAYLAHRFDLPARAAESREPS